MESIQKIAKKASIPWIPKALATIACRFPKVLVLVHVDALIRRQVLENELRMVKEHSTGKENVHTQVESKEIDKGILPRRSTCVQGHQHSMLQQTNRRHEHKQIKPLVIVQSNRISNKRTVMIKHETATMLESIMLAPRRPGNMTGMTQLWQFGRIHHTTLSSIRIRIQRGFIQIPPLVDIRIVRIQQARIGRARLVQRIRTRHPNERLHDMRQHVVPQDTGFGMQNGNKDVELIE